MSWHASEGLQNVARSHFQLHLNEQLLIDLPQICLIPPFKDICWSRSLPYPLIGYFSFFSFSHCVCILPCLYPIWGSLFGLGSRMQTWEKTNKFVFAMYPLRRWRCHMHEIRQGGKPPEQALVLLSFSVIEALPSRTWLTQAQWGSVQC